MAKTLQAHPIPRRWTIVSVMSITTALMGTLKKKKDARFALPNHTALGPIPRWKIARVMLTVGPVQATLQKATLAWQNAIRSCNKAVVV